MDQPLCGGSATGDSVFDKFIKVAGGALGVLGALGTMLGWFTDPAGHLVTLAQFTTYAAVAAGAAAGALATAGFVWTSALDRVSSREGYQKCYAGVVDTIVPAFSSAWEIVFPFTAHHDRTDVVLKSLYWDVVVLRPSAWVYCNDDSVHSPLLRSYYRSDETVGAAYGSLVGSVAGAMGGFLSGLLVGTAIGCAGGPVLCALAFLVAFLVAAIVTLAGAWLGGTVGRAIGGGDTDPQGTPVGKEGREEVIVGDYVTNHGNLIVYAEDKNAVVDWWVLSTSIHGRSTYGQGTGGNRPFTYTDADEHLEPDVCQTEKGYPPIE